MPSLFETFWILNYHFAIWFLMFDINGRIIQHQEKSEYQVRISRKRLSKQSNLIFFALFA